MKINNAAMPGSILTPRPELETMLHQRSDLVIGTHLHFFGWPVGEETRMSGRLPHTQKFDLAVDE